MRLIQSGSRQSKIMLVGEAPGADEDRIGRPFAGAAGRELDRELSQAHWSRDAFFITNVCHERPPSNEIETFFARKTEAKREGLIEVNGRYPRQPVLDGLAQLQRDIDEIQPTLIIALGNTALWALTGQTGILKWRGSVIPASDGPVDGHGIKLIAGLHTAAVLREQVYRPLAIADFRRALTESAYVEIRKPDWHFTIPVSVREVREWFQDSAGDNVNPICADVENYRGSGDLICLGFAVNKTTAICIPFTHRDPDKPTDYWSFNDELAITLLCRGMLKRRQVVFHNGLHDCQILSRHWGVMPRFEHDTMVMQHVAFPGMLGGRIDPISGKVDKKGSSLSLSFCASLYCDYYRFWKDDGRGWDESTDDERAYFNYNCEDCVRTFEVMEKLTEILVKHKLWEQYRFQMSLFPAVFDMMFRGCAFDNDLRRHYRDDVLRRSLELEEWINTAAGHPLNIRSSDQMKALFYDDLQCERVIHRKTKKPTLDDKALERIARRHAILKPFISRIQQTRTLDVFQDNFLKVRLRSADERLCSAFNVGFVETMRFSSNVNAFGEGWNSQNTPRNPDD